MRNKKTTISGILALVGTLAALVSNIMSGHPLDIPTTIVGISTGIGLLVAKDGNVTGGSISQPTVPNPPTLTETK